MNDAIVGYRPDLAISTRSPPQDRGRRIGRPQIHAELIAQRRALAVITRAPYAATAVTVLGLVAAHEKISASMTT